MGVPEQSDNDLQPLKIVAPKTKVVSLPVSKLSPKQTRAIELLATGRMQASVARTLKVSKMLVSKWMAQPLFVETLETAKREYTEAVAESLLPDCRITLKAMIKRKSNVAMKAIELVFAMAGIWPKKEGAAMTQKIEVRFDVLDDAERV